MSLKTSSFSVDFCLLYGLCKCIQFFSHYWKNCPSKRSNWIAMFSSSISAKTLSIKSDFYIRISGLNWKSTFTFSPFTCIVYMLDVVVVCCLHPLQLCHHPSSKATSFNRGPSISLQLPDSSLQSTKGNYNILHLLNSVRKSFFNGKYLIKW